MGNLDTYPDPLVGRIADKWDAAMINGHFPSLILMRIEDEELLRLGVGLDAGEVLTYRTTPVLGIPAGDVRQYGNIFIGRPEDLDSFREQIAQVGLPFQLADLEKGECWLLARWVGNVGEAG